MEDNLYQSEMAATGGGKVMAVSFVLVLCFEITVGMGNAISSTGPLPYVQSTMAQISALDGVCTSTVETHGYVCQEHNVTTKDGYILGIQRIPQGLTNDMNGSRTPVLLQHGLIVDGVSWMITSPQESLPFILADSGYDVWIANSRGTQWSRGHTSLDPNDPEYWDWTWDELAAYDLPAFVQYVYNQTKQKLNYVGHSQGTLIALVSLSQRKLLDNLNSAALLSPIAHMHQVTSLLVQGVARAFLAEGIYWLGLSEFDLKGEALSKLLEALCKDPTIDCADMITALTGKNCCINDSTIEIFVQHEPQATSTKNIIHFAQMIRTGTISMYDYGGVLGGVLQNMKHYGQMTPPVYDISSIPNDFPLFLSYGGQDALSDVNDVKLLLDDLKSHVSDKLTAQYIDNYAHADFIMATNAKQVVYDPMIAFFKRHGN